MILQAIGSESSRFRRIRQLAKDRNVGSSVIGKMIEPGLQQALMSSAKDEVILTVEDAKSFGTKYTACTGDLWPYLLSSCLGAGNLTYRSLAK